MSQENKENKEEIIKENIGNDENKGIKIEEKNGEKVEKEGKEDKEDKEEYLMNDFEENDLKISEDKKFKYKIVIIIAISLLAIGILTVAVLILLKEGKSNNNKDPVEVLPPIIINPTEEYTHCIIWLHGLDNSPENFQKLFGEEIPFIKQNNTKIILMRAPYQNVTYWGNNMTSWFDLFTFPIDDPDCYNFTDVNNSRRMLAKVIRQEAKLLKGQYQNIFVGGHSQGACISLYTAYNLKKLIGGVLVCSGILFEQAEIVGDKNKLKVFLAHGDKDQAIPFVYHKETVKRIENFEGVKKFYYEGHGHSIADFEKVDMGGFLNDSMI